MERKNNTLWSESSKRKQQQTWREKYGPNAHKRIGALGGRKRTRGYFGYLKDNDPEKLKEISASAGSHSPKKSAGKPSRSRATTRKAGK